jgi:hypothetical protein
MDFVYDMGRHGRAAIERRLQQPLFHKPGRSNFEEICRACTIAAMGKKRDTGVDRFRDLDDARQLRLATKVGEKCGLRACK